MTEPDPTSPNMNLPHLSCYNLALPDPSRPNLT